MSHSHPAYRPDIDGLRALAISSVLIYHAFPNNLKGGFVGVDIFFVISGYLISSNILNDLARGSFRFSGFYARRIRRIFPALALVLSVTLGLGWLLLDAHEFRHLGEHTAAGAGFVSNLALWRENGYFDAAAVTKPLIHLWSLGIEEQFYIAWPLVLVLLWARGRRILSGVCVIALGSFLLNLAIVYQRPAEAFYNPLTRVWELLIGAFLAHWIGAHAPQFSRAARNNLAVTGSLILAAALAWSGHARLFPGWWALLPTAGAALVILAGPDAWVNGHILAQRGVKFIGLISYPLYLWHWPLLTFLRYVDMTDIGMNRGQMRFARLGVFLVSLILAWATWRFWEAPLRRLKRIGRVPVVMALSIAVGLLGIAGCLGAAGWITPRLNDPGTRRLVEAIWDWQSLPYDNFKRSTFRFSEFPSRSGRATLFAGDSNAEHYWPRAQAVIAQDPNAATAIFATHRACPPVPGLNNSEAGYDCPKFNAWWMERAKTVDTVVISARWEFYFESVHEEASYVRPEVPLVTRDGRPASAIAVQQAWTTFEAYLHELTARGKRVYLFSSSPSSTTFDPASAVRRLSRGGPELLKPIDRAAFTRYIEPVESRLALIAARTGARLIRPTEFWCAGAVCPAVDAQGNPLYVDDNHLRFSAVARMATFVDECLR